DDDLLIAVSSVARASAGFINNAGVQSGTAELEETSRGVLITLEVSGLGAAGERAFHIHE
ncbi:MAG: superoxide dismutase family protein, partial [Alphaproteobacteria bacterium]|nr:superoxide dismutase family protein [Alphaproteobacteria bacterium]